MPYYSRERTPSYHNQTYDYRRPLDGHYSYNPKPLNPQYVPVTDGPYPNLYHDLSRYPDISQHHSRPGRHDPNYFDSHEAKPRHLDERFGRTPYRDTYPDHRSFANMSMNDTKAVIQHPRHHDQHSERRRRHSDTGHRAGHESARHLGRYFDSNDRRQEPTGFIAIQPQHDRRRAHSLVKERGGEYRMPADRHESRHHISKHRDRSAEYDRYDGHGKSHRSRDRYDSTSHQYGKHKEYRDMHREPKEYRDVGRARGHDEWHGAWDDHRRSSRHRDDESQTIKVLVGSSKTSLRKIVNFFKD
ncbi:hypothetical protein D9615_005774 [Tricholomella constricta]|uniref:Uncharacterized protein n=1 Tax=Tricholomella constricta TaxID=117010 RepID=A0A8H5M3T0_9AGAR|nr:hypothetical protein D9615_005774 [Tricholomella constricta]